MIQYRLTAGARINALGNESNPECARQALRRYRTGTAMHSTAERGNIEAVKFLPEYGADPMVKDRDVQTAAEILRERNI